MTDNKTKQLKPYPIVLTQDVAWGDMDAFGHINNTVYFRYFEVARMEYFNKINALVNMDETNIGPILANAYTDFKAPLTYPDSISIACRISDIHEKKFTMHYAVYSQSLDTIAAEGHGLIVYFDYNSRRSCPIPSTIVDNINKLENSVNHS